MKFFEVAYLCRVVREKVMSGIKVMPYEVEELKYLLDTIGEEPEVNYFSPSYYEKAYQDIDWVREYFEAEEDAEKLLDARADIYLLSSLNREAKRITESGLQELAEKVDTLAWNAPLLDTSIADTEEKIRWKQLPKIFEMMADGCDVYSYLLKLLPKLEEIYFKAE